jgi:hypothetical protein
MIKFNPACFYRTVIIKAVYHTNARVDLHFALYNVHWIGFEVNDIKLCFWFKNLINLQKHLLLHIPRNLGWPSLFIGTGMCIHDDNSTPK